MKLSIRVHYGLQALLELALNYGSGPLQIADIAKENKIPIRYLEQLLLVLKRGGLAGSTRGINGGYVLAKKPSEISLKEIVEVFEGPIELLNKKQKKSSILFEVFEKIQDNVNQQLSDITLEDLTIRKRQKDLAINYTI